MLNAVLEETMFWENGGVMEITQHIIVSTPPFSEILNVCFCIYHYSLYLNYTQLTLILKSTLKRG